MALARVRSSLRHRRSIQRLVAAGAVASLASALATIEGLASEPEEEASEVRTVRVSEADAVDLVAASGDGLEGVIGEALEARLELVASEPEPEPEPEPELEPAPEPEGTVDVATWDRLAACESGGNWSINTGNGFYGGLQFEVESWEWVGGTGMPHEASRQEQIARAEILLERQGWEAWPACSRQLGLR